jgi:8-oxo-dGTP pyrophosphatase MutT (NUDIX family)
MAKNGHRQAKTKPACQYAALPVRFAKDGGIEVLLLASHDTKRWVIPKGWPISPLSASAAAAREAFEEAGLRGIIAEVPIGNYRYRKRLRNGKSAMIDVDVFIFKVLRQLRKWPEKAQRRTRWHDPMEAADLVQEPDLAHLLRQVPEMKQAIALLPAEDVAAGAA